jgi:hypothetical protein
MAFENIQPIIDELNLESDRGLVLVAGAMLENELENHLTHRFRPKLENKDELLNRADFETKITLSYRTGLITESEFKIYNQLRNLRNTCAHDVSEQTFDKDHFKARMVNILELSPQIWYALKNDETVIEYVNRVGWRESFTLFFGLIIKHKRESIGRVPQISELSKT